MSGLALLITILTFLQEISILETYSSIAGELPPALSRSLYLPWTVYWLFGMAAASKGHRQLLKRLQRDYYTYETSNTAEIVRVVLLLIGLVSFIGVLIKQQVASPNTGAK